MTIRGIDTEVAKQPPSGCVRYKKEWPNARFSREAEAIGRGEHPEHICDLCLEFAPDAISEAISEATAERGQESPAQNMFWLIREVRVTEVESKSNVIAFSYVTHRGTKPMSFTDLYVEFKG